MDFDLSKIGIDPKGLEKAALGDFDDYVEKMDETNSSLKKNDVIPATTKEEPIPVSKISEPAPTVPKANAVSIFKKVDSAPSLPKADPDSAITKEDPIPDLPKADPVSSLLMSDSDVAANSELAEIPKEKKVHTIYIWEFLKSLAHKERIGVDIWLCINFIVIALPLFLITMNPVSFALTIPLYFFSLCIALSPIGEWILRWTNHCHSIAKTKNADVNRRLSPLFEEVYAKARALNPAISKDVKLFVCEDESPNAFATGRKTVVVTRGLLELENEEIKGILAHEFGHLSHKDTDIVLVVAVGNMIVNVLMLLAALFLDIFALAISAALRSNGHPHIANGFNKICYFIGFAISWIWTKFGTLLCLHSGRKNEHKADNFAVDLGYHKQLANALTQIDGEDYSSPKGLWATLNSTHPDTPDRIASMELYIAEKKNKLDGIE